MANIKVEPEPESEFEAIIRNLKLKWPFMILVAFFLLAVFSPIYTIGPGERGILITMGRPDLDAKGEGLHFKAPLIQEVITMSVRTEKEAANASAASKDLQVVETEVALNYHLLPESVVKIYQNIGLDYKVKIIDSAIQEAVKASTAKYTAEELITKRDEVKLAIQDHVLQRLSTYGIIAEAVMITDFDFSPSFNSAIEEKVTQEQLALKARWELERVKTETQQKVAAATAEAESVSLVAQARANATIMQAEAEAKAFELKKQQLNDKLIALEYIKALQNWDGKLPVMVGGTSPILPLMNLQAPINLTVQ